MVSFGVHNKESQWRGNAWVSADDEMDDRQILSKTSREKLISHRIQTIHLVCLKRVLIPTLHSLEGMHSLLLLLLATISMEALVKFFIFETSKLAGKVQKGKLMSRAFSNSAQASLEEMWCFSSLKCTTTG